MTYIINHRCSLFDKKEAEQIFNDNNKFLNCPFTFKDLANNDWFFTVMNNKGETIGITYVLCEKIDNKEVPFYSGASKRHHHRDMIEAHKILLGLLFKEYEEVYTWSPYKHGHIFNKKAGMQYIGNNTFKINKLDFLGE